MGQSLSSSAENVEEEKNDRMFLGTQILPEYLSCAAADYREGEQYFTQSDYSMANLKFYQVINKLVDNDTHLQPSFTLETSDSNFSLQRIQIYVKKHIEENKEKQIKLHKLLLNISTKLLLDKPIHTDAFTEELLNLSFEDEELLIAGEGYDEKKRNSLKYSVVDYLTAIQHLIAQYPTVFVYAIRQEFRAENLAGMVDIFLADCCLFLALGHEALACLEEAKIFFELSLALQQVLYGETSIHYAISELYYGSLLSVDHLVRQGIETLWHHLHLANTQHTHNTNNTNNNNNNNSNTMQHMIQMKVGKVIAWYHTIGEDLIPVALKDFWNDLNHTVNANANECKGVKNACQGLHLIRDKVEDEDEEGVIDVTDEAAMNVWANIQSTTMIATNHIQSPYGEDEDEDEEDDEGIQQLMALETASETLFQEESDSDDNNDNDQAE